MTLSARELTVNYGSFTAVRDVDLDVADGEVLALLGPSGSGKSTLLRAIAGLEPGATGSLRWDGVDLAPVPVHRRGFGLVFQEGQLFNHRDVAGNIGFGLRMRGATRAARQRRVGELLELVGLPGYQRSRVTALSGGQAQRVALARALAPRPRLLLLDEPLSGLDAELREQLAIDLAGLFRATGVTALLVTHDQEEAFTLADRVAVLHEGQVRQTGPVREVWRQPTDERVARFLGVTAFVDADVAGGLARGPLGEVALPRAASGRVRLGLRPAALRLADDGDVTGDVLSTVHRRDHVRLLVHPDGLDFAVDATAPITTEVQPGSRVALRLDADGVAVLAARHTTPDQPRPFVDELP